MIPKQVKNHERFKDKNRLVKAKAGDLILFDSRTIHGGIVGPGYEKAEDCSLNQEQFARLAATICMAPKDKVKDK